jgi:hypothetical protein
MRPKPDPFTKHRLTRDRARYEQYLALRAAHGVNRAGIELPQPLEVIADLGDFITGRPDGPPPQPQDLLNPHLYVGTPDPASMI